MDASMISACIAAISATVSAFSAWNSRRSAQASQAALQDSREQRKIDNSRADLIALGNVYDDCMNLIESLDRDLTRDPTKVHRYRETLRRSSLVAGVMTPALEVLMASTAPLSSQQVTQIREDLLSMSTSLRQSTSLVERRIDTAPGSPALGPTLSNVDE